jgi:hypothetical protein
MLPIGDRSADIKISMPPPFLYLKTTYTSLDTGGIIIELLQGFKDSEVGTAFGKIVSSHVKYVKIPPKRLLLGGKDFSNVRFELPKGGNAAKVAASEAGLTC